MKLLRNNSGKLVDYAFEIHFEKTGHIAEINLSTQIMLFTSVRHSNTF